MLVRIVRAAHGFGERYLSEPMRAALILCALLMLFFSEPLLTTGYYAPTDILQGSALLRIAPPDYVRKNAMMSDVVNQMHPFLAWNRAELLSARLPTWNPYNGLGAPHLANYQSAVFSPFSLPFYLLDWRIALVVSAFLKLFSLGFYTYLYLRVITVWHAPALVGAVAFMFSGYNLLWLNWQHVGAAIVLPAGLYYLERVVQRSSAGTRARLGSLAGLTLAIAAGLLAGHPETFFYSALLVGAYGCIRLLAGSENWPVRGRILLEASAAALLALGIAAVQLIPFIEYLHHSTVFAVRPVSHEIYPLNPYLIGLHAFPNLLGSPTLPYYDRLLADGRNYNEVNGSYVGLAALFLASLAVVGLPYHRSRPALFFSSIALAWLAYAYNLAGVAHLLKSLPIIELGVIARSHTIWGFSVSILAALALQQLACNERWRRPPRVVIAIGCGVILGLLAWRSAEMLLAWAAGQPGNSVGSPAALAVVGSHRRQIGVGFIAAVLIVTFAAARGLDQRRLGLISTVLGAIIVAQSGLLLRQHNPTIAAEYHYPTTTALRAIAARVGDTQTMFLDAALLPPASNLWYRLRSPKAYDAMGIRDYDTLYGRVFGAMSYDNDARPQSLRALQIMGVHYLVTAQPYPFATPATEQAPASGQAHATEPLRAGQILEQRFTATQPDLAALVVALTAVGAANDCTITLRLDQVAPDRPVAEQQVRCADLAANSGYLMRFEPQPDSQGRLYRLRVTSPDARRDSSAVLYAYDQAVADGEFLVDGRSSAARLVFDSYAARIGGLLPVWDDGTIRLFRVPDSLPRYYSVTYARVAASEEAALAMLFAADFQPWDEIVVGGDIPARSIDSPSTAERVTPQILEETPTRVRLRIQLEDAGWLVALQTFYPGWSASVNGRPAEIVRANTAFSAIRVERGSSEILLWYDPPSVRYGALISLASLVLVTAALIDVSIRRFGRPEQTG